MTMLTMSRADTAESAPPDPFCAAHPPKALANIPPPTTDTTITAMPADPVPNPPTLADMIERKRAQVERLKAGISMTELEAAVAQADPPRNFFSAVANHSDAVHFSIIAEIARRTPWTGPLRPEFAADGDGGFTPETIASDLYGNGAAALSYATDEQDYGGHIARLDRIKQVTPLPVLRRDIIIDPWQLWESRAAGADAVLLIAEALNESEIVDMLILSQQLQMTALLEVHDMENLLRVRPYVGFPHEGYSLLGINNRDLNTGRVDLGHTLRLADLSERRSILVTENGIETRDDLLKLRSVGVRIAMVSLLHHADPGGALRRLVRSPFSDRMR
jgi:indole-3-glycerol phosphate synthase